MRDLIEPLIVPAILLTALRGAAGRGRHHDAHRLGRPGLCLRLGHGQGAQKCQENEPHAHRKSSRTCRTIKGIEGGRGILFQSHRASRAGARPGCARAQHLKFLDPAPIPSLDRKSTRLNSSH